MEKVIRLLQPFEEDTVLLSSNNAPISAVIPAVSVLKHFLAKDDGDKSTGVRTMKQEFHDAVTSRFEQILANENYIIATTVDPRFKTAFTASQGHNLLLQEVERLAEPEELEESTTATPENAEISAPSASVSEDTKNPTPSEKKEVDAFLMLPLLAKDECPYKWWAAKKMAYPNIYKVAKKFLSAPCSSVYSERIFSEAGNTIEDSRNRLNPSKSESLLFLHHNLPRLNFDY
ncbi:zinc finger BED domain-containing protein 4-like [Dendronephthya gigantea]|uniref:zinc finger BED domain-containing protein 4-like n=1 Tax=Dendronephthya gigantea TaxID=151771 RepID=UPI00106BA5FE|nr:zinc finger BED domain-containing protein 4-like [Dendronephthya gigantea]